LNLSHTARQWRVAFVDTRCRRVVDRGVQLGRVVDVDPLVGGEVRVDRQCLQAVLVVAVDGDRGDDRARAGRRIVDADLAAAGVVQHPAVRQDRQRHRLAGLVVERDLLVVAEHGRAAVALDHARGPLDAAEQMLAHVAIAVGLDGVAEPGVPAAAARLVLAPGDRVVEAHGSAGERTLVGGGQHVLLATHVGREVVPLLGQCERARHGLGRRVGAIRDRDVASADARDTGDLGADEFLVEGPVRLSLGSRVYADVAAARADVALESGLLGGVEHVTSGVEEHHGAELGQVRRRERGGVLGDGDPETVVLGQVPDGLHTVPDGRTAHTVGLGEHEHAVGLGCPDVRAQCGRAVFLNGEVAVVGGGGGGAGRCPGECER
jgi:hypothetical protein